MTECEREKGGMLSLSCAQEETTERRLADGEEAEGENVGMREEKGRALISFLEAQ